MTVSILFIALITVISISFLSNWFVNRQFVTYITKQERTQSENIVKDLGRLYNGLTRSWDPDFLHTIGMYSLYEGYILKVYDLNGKVIWDAESHDIDLCRQIMSEISMRMGATGSKEEFIAHTYSISSTGQTVGSVSIKYHGDYFFSENDLLYKKAINTALVVIGFGALLVSLVAGWLLARLVARPVIRTAHIARQIAKGNYNIRFEGKTKTTELDILGTAVNQLADSLGEQESLRKQMTSDLSHELRTPITTVGSHLEAMIDGVWEPTPDRLKSCHEEIDRLSRMVVDLERLAKVEGDVLKLKKTSVDLLDVARAVGERLRIEADKKKLTLSIEGESSTVNADRDRIGQVVTNLLTNAIKYTPDEGRVSVSVQDLDRSGVLKVQDTGIGIPEKEIPLVFERFYRTDKSRSRKTGGIGIGLTIAKSIVTAHGGSVTVLSKPDLGSCFTVTLPKS